MPEDAVTAPVETQAPDSSTGSETPAFEIPKNPAEYAHWRMTGELPDKPKADSTPATKESEKAPESDTGKPAEKTQHRAGADERLREILADLKEAGLTPKELKTFKREAQREERKPESRPESREQPAAPPQPQMLEPPKKPKYEDFGDWEKYEAAKDKYYEDLADYKAGMRVAQDRAEQAQQAAQKIWREKLNEAATRYGAEAETAIVDTARAISGDQQIHPAVKAVLDDSPVLTDVLYVMGSNEAALQEFVKLARESPGQAIRKAVLLERLVQEELQKGAATTNGPARAEDGKFQAASPAAKKVSQAPPPPREVATRSGPPPDEVETAIRNNDFRTFREVENRKQLQKMKGL